jgi:hypothetical protein
MKKIVLLVVVGLALFGFGCGESSSPDSDGGDDGYQQTDLDDGQNNGSDDGGIVDDNIGTETDPNDNDTSDEDNQTDEDPGPLTLGSVCDPDNNQCPSEYAFCHQHDMGETLLSYCTRTECNVESDDCPSGYTCNDELAAAEPPAGPTICQKQCFGGGYVGQLGESCLCDADCGQNYAYCFKEFLLDNGDTYCTIADCTVSPDSCPENYRCNDFYTVADPPQPPFCQKCLGGSPLEIGQDCLCDSDCGSTAPDCFKDITDPVDPPASCTIRNCTVGEGDQCPTGFECSNSIDMTNQENPMTTFCKYCDPGDGSIAEGGECGCNIDCAGNAICPVNLFSEEPRTCQLCLGGTPRGFGETCECDSDCGSEFPFCLVTNKYCSVLDCMNDPGMCPEGSTCKDVFGMFSFCEKN